MSKKFNSFEDIIAWQKARELNRDIYKISNNEKFSKDFSLKDQIRRASISVMSNIAEGVERSGNREFINFLSIAKGSIGEVRSQLYIGYDLGYISNAEFEKLLQDVTQIGKIIGGLINYLKESDIKGHKFKEPETEYYITNKE